MVKTHSLKFGINLEFGMNYCGRQNNDPPKVFMFLSLGTYEHIYYTERGIKVANQLT